MRIHPTALVALLAAVSVACGRGESGDPDAASSGDADGALTDGGLDGPLLDGTGGSDALVDALVDAPSTPDAFPAVLDLRIDCHNTCVLTANPPRIDVPTGTSFEVNWVNVGDTECDVAKVDQFNQVPIIIGLEPGTSYHDSVREWCGPFTGTFDFRVSICTIHSYIPVDCSAP